MAAVEGTGGHPTGMFKTLRTDAWWFEPLWTGLGFLIFTIYANYEMFKGDHYWWSDGGTGFGGYLSPFFSPLLFIEPGVWEAGKAPHSFFGDQPGWWPTWFPSISAALILPLPLSFRLTCYYYRKFYYRAYFMSPPACAVNPAPQPGKYEGERMLLLFQNLHRYALYAAIVVLGFLLHDAYMSFFRDGKFGVGVGSIILTLNPILLGMYTPPRRRPQGLFQLRCDQPRSRHDPLVRPLAGGHLAQRTPHALGVGQHDLGGVDRGVCTPRRDRYDSRLQHVGKLECST